MSGDCLVLNSSYEPLSVIPLSIISWQRAIKLIWLERVHVLENYQDRHIHSQKLVMPVPAVVMTNEYFNFKKAIRYSKSNVFLRDLYQCQYCCETFEQKDLTIDHVIPRALGGKTSWENCVTACNACNAEKADRTDMSPKRPGFKPDMHSMAFNMRDKPVYIQHPSWEQYLEPYRKVMNPTEEVA